jgi:hypothetical protein
MPGLARGDPNRVRREFIFDSPISHWHRSPSNFWQSPGTGPVYPALPDQSIMAHLVGNLLVAQSGGPTVVINASVAGVITEASKHECIEEMYGCLLYTSPSPRDH